MGGVGELVGWWEGLVDWWVRLVGWLGGGTPHSSFVGNPQRTSCNLCASVP